MEKIEFRAYKQRFRFYDPTQNFEPTERVIEIRKDPLTERTSHILGSGFQVEKPDLEEIVSRARSDFNPFAADTRDQATPRFLEEDLPEGRFSVGEALVIPNLFPRDRFSAVTILSEADYIPLTGFTQETLVNAFSADLTYLERMRDKDPELKHFSANWNYMHLAGASLIHPHHQLIASPIPTNYLREVETGLHKYEGNYFDDLVITEEERDERWIGRLGSVAWMMGYAPLGPLDIVGVFEGKRSLFHLVHEDLAALSQGLLRMFGFLDSENFVSFNFALYGLEGVRNFTVHCRLSPRFVLSTSLMNSEMNYFEVVRDDPLIYFSPEAYAHRVRSRF
jgi:UDPglucose--hexose-1-phosphate uridylyltransferase